MSPNSAGGRRLSPLRVILAALVAVVVVAAGTAGLQWWSARASVDVKPWFASYVDVTATPRFAFENLGAGQTKDAVLSFVVSSKSSACTPSWGADYSLDEARGALDLDRRIARLQQQGGTIAVSFGGQANSELAVGCTNPSSLQSAYAAVIDRYKVGTIDLDLEGDGLGDAATNARRATAIAALQADHRVAGKGLAVWLTLPVSPTGLTAQGTDAIAAMLKAKVDIAGVNVMTMDFGAAKDTSTSMVVTSEKAATAAQRQLGVLYDRAKLHQSDPSLWAKLGATPMIGQNDDQGEIFTLSDAKALNTWAASTGVGRMSMWSANRDKACGANYVDTSVVSDACSGVRQGKAAFATALAAGFDGHISLGAGAVTTAEPQAAAVTDDPAESPYPVWAASASYLTGTKVVWHHTVYVAKWWTKGDLPDNPVLNSWETPWQLVGPVLPGETPIPQPTLPPSTYPNWAGTTIYNAGQRVLFAGVPFEAKWWTQGDSPEASSANPDSSPWAPLTQDEIDRILGGHTTTK